MKNPGQCPAVSCGHLGFMISGHPLDFIEMPHGIVRACDIRSHANQTVRIIGWGIAAKVLSAKNNRKPMKMLTLEDRTGTYEATLFPRVYAKFAPRTHWRRRSRRICH
jgi:DNA polymerase III alpha subunit